MSVASRSAILGSIIVSIAFVMELTLVPLLLPAIQKQFALSIGELAWVFNTYGFAVVAGVLLGGWLGDALNTRRVFAAGVLLFSSGSAVVACAGSYEALVLGRLLQGFGGGVFSPLIPIILTRLSPHRPGKILIVWGSVVGYVAAFAPFLYGSTLAAYSWHFAFVIFAVASMAGWAIVQGSRKGDEPASSSRSDPKMSTLLGASKLWLIFGYVFCTYGSITYFLFRLPLWLAGHDFPVVGIGFTLSVVWLSFSVVSALLRNWVDEPHLRSIILVAPLLIACGFPLAYFCNYVSCVLASSFLIGAGLACSNAPSTHLVLKFAPTGMSALSASLDITFARLGGVATVALLAQSMISYAVLAVIVMSILAILFAATAAKGFDRAS